jgi:hypothetical protein
MKSAKHEPSRFRIAGHSNKLTGLSLAVAFAVIGTTLLLATHAATPVVSLEPENGTHTGSATVVTDTSASGSKYVKFSAVTTPPPPPPPGQIPGVSSATPCVGYSTPPAHWNHIVVLMFENQTMPGILSNAQTPFTANFISTKCGSITNYHDANYKVDGSKDGGYNSKPQYALLTNGQPGSVTGFVDDNYLTVKDVDNIYNRLNLMGKTAKNYVDGPGNNCSTKSFSGEYHDAMRYYADLGGRSATPTTYCNTHDVNIGQFMTDVNSGKLPSFSMIIPTNNENMHSDTWAAGDAFAKSFLTPLLDSAQYKSGDTAIFWLWDEDSPTPNSEISPYIHAGSHPAATPANQPIGHYTMLRTWEDMLGITPYLGNTGQTTSLKSYYEGH